MGRAKKLVAAAICNPFRQARRQRHLFSLQVFIQMLLKYKGHLFASENEIDALDVEIEEYQIIQSIPGIGGSSHMLHNGSDTTKGCPTTH